MNITFAHNPQSFGITPATLLKRCSQNKAPDRYEYDKNSDPLQADLDNLAYNYDIDIKIDRNISAKKKILLKEREMLFEELQHPELTLARNYDNVMRTIPKDVQGKEFTDALRLFSLEGLTRNYSLGIISNVAPTNKEISILKKTYTKLDEGTKTGKDGKEKILTIMRFMKSKPKFKDKINETFNYFYENTEDEDLKNTLLDITTSNNPKKLLEDYRNEPDNDKKFRRVLIYSKVNDEEVTQQINSILKSDNAPKDIMRSAILGAGKFRSDENFEIIKEIALNKDEKDIRKREFAIHSTALYLQEKSGEVNTIMDEIKNDGTIFSPLATIIKDKITGNYHGQENREMNYAGMNKFETKEYDYRVFEYIQPFVKLNRQEKNAIMRSLVPFRNFMPDINKNGYQSYISDDTLTVLDASAAGKRQFVSGRDLSYSGTFFDGLEGMCQDKWNFINSGLVSHSPHNNTIAHETGHLIHHLSNDIENNVKNLYKNAMENNLALNDYAAICDTEYFACACDAYAATYIPHAYLLDATCRVHSKYELMDRDPDLYNYIDHLAKDWE